MIIITISILSVALHNPTIILYRQQNALAQINDTIFKMYENSAYEIKIKYPSDWKKVEPSQISDESNFNIIVGFLSPKESTLYKSHPAALSIGIQNLSTSQSITVDQYSGAQINLIRQQASVLESNTTTLKGSNNTLAHKIVYINNEGQKVMQVWTIKGDKAYHITYAANETRYYDYIPPVQKMIDSFEINIPLEQGPYVTIDKEDNTAVSTTTSLSPCCPSNRYIANAGPDQTVLEGTIITLNGSSTNNKSTNIANNTVNYLWRQMAGPAIILNGNNTAHPTFVAPNYPNNTKYTFALEVFENQVNNNNNNQTGSAIDTVDTIVKDVNIEAKSPKSLQEEDDNTKEQSNQDELQDGGTTGDDDEFSDDDDSDDSTDDGDDGDGNDGGDGGGDEGDEG
jgi:hypothetical protein